VNDRKYRKQKVVASELSRRHNGWMLALLLQMIEFRITPGCTGKSHEKINKHIGPL